MGIVDGNGFLFALQTIIGDVVIPGNIFLVNELALLALCPNGAFRLIDTDDVDCLV